MCISATSFLSCLHTRKNWQQMLKLNYSLRPKLWTKYNNTSQTCDSKLAKFFNSRFLSLFFTSKLAVPLLSTQICDFCYNLSPKIREFGGITVFGLGVFSNIHQIRFSKNFTIWKIVWRLLQYVLLTIFEKKNVNLSKIDRVGRFKLAYVQTILL